LKGERYAGRLAGFVLVSEDGKIVLQHRTEDVEKLPDYWSFFGGGIEGDETPEKTVRREAREELGIELTGLRMFGTYESWRDDGLWEKTIFTALLSHSLEHLRRQQQEGQGLGLFSFEELKALKITAEDMIILKEVFNKLRTP
jgi:8-oxo-dGTP diphosphatase